jgi:CheY-like chemotaxis protein
MFLMTEHTILWRKDKEKVVARGVEADAIGDEISQRQERAIPAAVGFPFQGHRSLVRVGARDGAGRRIAIADDEEDLIAVLVIMLRKWNYSVEMAASDGAEIVDAIANKKIRPQVVLMDYRMKATNGLEAAKRILCLDPSIKVIVTSADDSIRLRVAEAGLVLLPKPYSSAQLKRALDGP